MSPPKKPEKGCIDCDHCFIDVVGRDKEIVRICRRFPPTPVCIHTQNGPMIQMIWVQVAPDHLCSEFKPKAFSLLQ